jgi:hypothetical protein
VKETLIGLLLGLVIGGAAMWSYQKRHPGPPAPEEKKEEKKELSYVQRGTNGETYLKLDQETQARMGLKTALLEGARLKPEIKGYGRVLDPTPLVALVVERANAESALAASTREFERLKTLEKTQNASARAVELAEAALRRDRIALESIPPRLNLGWGRAVAGRSDLQTFAFSLASQDAALIRVDLPLGQSLQGPPTGGKLAALTAAEKLVEAQYLGPAPNADPQMQAQGFLFLHQGRELPPGAAVVAWLSVPGEEEAGVSLPREALVRHEGEVFVYVQTTAETFNRKEVELERPFGGGWFVHEGLKAQDKVVVVGAQQLLSEELKGQGGEE